MSQLRSCQMRAQIITLWGGGKGGKILHIQLVSKYSMIKDPFRREREREREIGREISLKVS